jgi:hypothetical protein
VPGLCSRHVSGNTRDIMKVEFGGVSTPGAIAQTLEVLREAPGDHMKDPLSNTPLAKMDYHQVSRDELSLFPDIQVAPAQKQDHVARVQPACIHAMERALEEFGRYDPPEPQPQLPSGVYVGAPGYDPISGRRTAKRNYGEDQAKKWAEERRGTVIPAPDGDALPQEGPGG